MSQPPASKSWTLRVFIVLLILVAIGWGVLFALRPVALVAVATKGLAVRTVPGTVEVKSEFDQALKSEVSGRIKSSELDVGKRIYKGDLLVQLDTGDVDLEIERIKNEIEAAQRKLQVGSTLRADVLNKRDTIANLERQVKGGTFAAGDLEKEKRTLEQLEQRMELDEVNLKLALDTLENSLRVKEREKGKMTMYATDEGVITQVFARVGHLIGANTPIASIIAVDRTVEAKLSEENFAAVKVGQKASVRFLTYGAEQYDAVISKVLPSADAATQRYQIHLDVILPDGRSLVPGLTGEVSIVIDERPNAIIIPRRAMVGDYVYVVEGSQLVRRQVEKGFESLNQIEITKGLKVGEQVVVEQQDRFRDGDRVRTQVLGAN